MCSKAKYMIHHKRRFAVSTEVLFLLFLGLLIIAYPAGLYVFYKAYKKNTIDPVYYTPSYQRSDVADEQI